MSTPPDTLVKFNQCRSSPDRYPLNLIRTEVYQHALESYAKKLKDDRYFDKTWRSLFLFDLAESGKGEFEPSPRLDTLDEVTQCVGSQEKDPWWRFIFFQSQSSRSPLGCTREQLQFLLTHHQVMPGFLDFVFSFKARGRPLAQAVFRHENYLEKEDSVYDLPTLGRSSNLIQHAFNILSVEKSDRQGEKNPWPLRHTTLYHSFDLQNGRALWAVMKGNSSMKGRLVKGFKHHRDLQPGAMKSPARSFVASLHVHLIVLEWCIENWGEYIDVIDDERNDKSTDAKYVPVAAMTSPASLAQSFPRRETMSSNFSHQSTIYKSDSFSRGSSSTHSSPTKQSFTRSFSDFLRRGSGLTSLQTDSLPEGQAVQNESAKDRALIDDLDVRFSFDEFQRLSSLGDELEQAIIAIEQNKGVIAEINTQYDMATNSVAFTAAMDMGEFKGEISAFFRKLNSIGRELEMHLSRLKALARTVDNDKTMFDAVLQYKSAKTSEFFAKSAKDSSERMEDWTVKMHTIAVKTEQETVSMHVITVFTLIFLPGTFLATFFSSGVLHWNEKDPDLGSDWVVRPDGMKLFFYICAPMMVIILAGWAYMYWKLRRSREEVQNAMDNMEKGTLTKPPTGPAPGGLGIIQQ